MTPFSIGRVFARFVPCVVLAAIGRIYAAPVGEFDRAIDIGKISLPGSAEFLPDMRTYRITGSGANMWFKVNDRQRIELRAEVIAGSDRLLRVGLITDNAEGMRRYLASRGHPVPAALDPAIDRDLRFTVRDPDGRAIECQINCYDVDGTRTEMMEPGTVDGRLVPSSLVPPPQQSR